MRPRLLSVRGCGLFGLAAFILSILFATSTRAEAPKPEETLSPGEARERPIAAGETHSWRVVMPPGTNLLVTVEQHSIALVVEARGPREREPIAVTASRDSWGSEVLLLDRAGETRIEVRSRDKSAWPGRYTLRIDVLPERKSAKRDALALMSRAGRETLPDTPDSRRQAEATYREALVVWRALGERAWEAEALTCLAMLESEASDLQTSTEDFLAALPIWREFGKPQREADALNWLGVIYQDTQGTEKARETWESALSLWRSLGEPFDEEQTRGNLCVLEAAIGSLTTALACNQETLEFFRGHGITTLEAEILNRIGGVYDLQGEPDAALVSYQQALALWRTLAARDKEAKTLNNIAVVYRRLGDWQEALRFYDRSREVWGPAGDPALAATLLNNIAFSYSNLGEPRRALGLLEDALKLHREVGSRSGEIFTLNNLGTVWRKLGKLEKALDRHQQALALARSLQSDQQQAASRLGLAEVYLDRGYATPALRELETALPVLREKGDRHTQANALDLQGRALTLAGRPREALPALQEVLARRQAVRDRAGEAETLYALALAERSLGLAAEARSHAEAAVNLVEALRTGVLSVDLRASFLATRRRSYSLLIDLLMDRNAADPRKGHDREAFAISERARARGLLDVLRAGSAGRTASTAPPELFTRRLTLLRRLSAKVDRRWKENGTRADALGKEIDGILAEADGVEAEIRRYDSRFADFSAPQPVSPEEISRGLEPGTMLLEYSLGDDRSFLWAIEDGQVRSFVLPGQTKIEALARQVYKKMSTVESGSARQREAAEALGKILLGPIWSPPRGSVPLRRLVVVPDGVLAILPFAALPVPDPGRSWQTPGTLLPLLERLEVVSIPSATTLAVQRQRLQKRAEAPRWAMVFADPVFTASDPRLAHRSAENTRGGPLPRLERLPATRREADAVAFLAPAGEVTLDLGLAASREAALAADLRNYRIVHFATHALADLQNPELSGLVLSQVDAEGHPREGFLGLSDIYELDLNADLVVLSGCRTALGKEVRGEGLMGLTRGFQYAGVPRVVASLWPVQDHATAELMSRFYRAMWRDHLPAAAALREAQRSLRRDPRYRNPYSWAGFVLQGDWR
ncbi:MAG TPA: CHAT domain-containing tetratricopeptide repeat protein [Thermoanaerobaculia bacterium]|jgi:CHAT domain-containing protein/Tfp pilus assembly protein PilF|nr:CHAT domain-containing tetratricopeptide repeat protein [Thermoanaerobaculia bacterium]